MARVIVPEDVHPDEAAAAVAAVTMFLQDETEEAADGRSERWLLTGRLESQGVFEGPEMVRRSRRR
jgi:hypothetical protein